jgi:hypothetical protein
MTARGETESDGVNTGRLYKSLTENEGTREVAKNKVVKLNKVSSVI